jgi:hypothetical protein
VEAFAGVSNVAVFAEWNFARLGPKKSLLKRLRLILPWSTAFLT